MTTIFEAKCEMDPEEDSIQVQPLKHSLMFLGHDDETNVHTSAVLGPEAVAKLRDALTQWLEGVE